MEYEIHLAISYSYAITNPFYILGPLANLDALTHVVLYDIMFY